MSEKKRRAAADRLSESAFEASSRLCSEVTAVIGLPFVIVLAIFLQLLRSDLHKINYDTANPIDIM